VNVFAVQYDTGDGICLEGLFSTQEKAEEFAKEYAKSEPYVKRFDLLVEEWTLDGGAEEKRREYTGYVWSNGVEDVHYRDWEALTREVVGLLPCWFREQDGLIQSYVRILAHSNEEADKLIKEFIPKMSDLAKEMKDSG
jgi:hypothetical protein